MLEVFLHEESPVPDLGVWPRLWGAAEAVDSGPAFGGLFLLVVVVCRLGMPTRKQPDNHPQHAEAVLAPFRADRRGKSLQPCTLECMPGGISLSTGHTAPDHIGHAGPRTKAPAATLARRGSVTGRIAADGVLVAARVVHDGDYGVGTVDEEGGAFCDEVRGSELAAFGAGGALDEMRVDCFWVRLGLGGEEVDYVVWEVWCLLVLVVVLKVRVRVGFDGEV